MFASRTSALVSANSKASGRSLTIARADIKIGGKACMEKVSERKEIESKGKVFKVKFLAIGETREIEVPDDMYLLDAAEKNGIDLPATCRGGICGACVARVAVGTVDMSDIDDLEFTVSPEEQKEGMTLLCMARATSDLEIETQCDWGYSLGQEGGWKGATGKFSATPEKLV
eukprot:gene30856-35901_t